MRTALCLSGQPRSVSQAFPFIQKNIIEPNSPDVYVHAWVDEHIRGSKPLAACGAIASDTIPENIEDVILDLYHPVDYIFEEQIQFDTKDYHERKAPMIKPQNSMSQWYSAKECFSMIDTEKYDRVFRMRFDWAITVPVIVGEYMNAILCPNDCPHPNGINDQFAVGPTEHMRIYMSLFDHIDDIYRSGVRYCDEQLLHAHLTNNEIYMHKVDIPYNIIRYSEDLHGRYEGEFYEGP